MTNTASVITPQIFVLTLFLAIGWGIYLVFTVREFRRIRRESSERRMHDVVPNFRRMIAAFCLWMLPVSFLIRTGLVLAGLGADVVGIVLFFSLAGTNVLGVVIVLLTLSKRFRV